MRAARGSNCPEPRWSHRGRAVGHRHRHRGSATADELPPTLEARATAGGDPDRVRRPRIRRGRADHRRWRPGGRRPHRPARQLEGLRRPALPGGDLPQRPVQRGRSARVCRPRRPTRSTPATTYPVSRRPPCSSPAGSCKAKSGEFSAEARAVAGSSDAPPPSVSHEATGRRPSRSADRGGVQPGDLHGDGVRIGDALSIGAVVGQGQGDERPRCPRSSGRRSSRSKASSIAGQAVSSARPGLVLPGGGKGPLPDGSALMQALKKRRHHDHLPEARADAEGVTSAGLIITQDVLLPPVRRSGSPTPSAGPAPRPHPSRTATTNKSP